MKPIINRQTVHGIDKIISVASGKGGVGKSTISINIAIGLHNLGLKVALLDADIYGPSIPLMMNLRVKYISLFLYFYFIEN